MTVFKLEKFINCCISVNGNPSWWSGWNCRLPLVVMNAGPSILPPCIRGIPCSEDRTENTPVWICLTRGKGNVCRCSICPSAPTSVGANCCPLDWEHFGILAEFSAGGWCTEGGARWWDAVGSPSAAAPSSSFSGLTTASSSTGASWRCCCLGHWRPCGRDVVPLGIWPNRKPRRKVTENPTARCCRGLLSDLAAPTRLCCNGVEMRGQG